MAARAETVPLGKAPARKKAATGTSPRAGALEKAVISAIAAATKAKAMTSPWDQVTAEILKATARAADKALAAGERQEFQTHVDKMREVLAELDPDRGGGDDAGGRGDPVDRELAQILGSGPAVHHAKNRS